MDLLVGRKNPVLLLYAWLHKNFWRKHLKIEILNTDVQHPINKYLDIWKREHEIRHSVSIVRYASELTGGDILFLVSCNEKVYQEQLKLFDRSFVLHASDLPIGRGWSPHIWDLIHGADKIWLSLLAVAEQIDEGDIFFKQPIEIPNSALWDEINDLLFTAELKLMDFAIKNHKKITPNPQCESIDPTYHRKRTPQDSEINPDKSIADQFNLMRVCDPERYPAYFKLHGAKYKLILEKL